MRETVLFLDATQRGVELPDGYLDGIGKWGVEFRGIFACAARELSSSHSTGARIFASGQARAALEEAFACAALHGADLLYVRVPLQPSSALLEALRTQLYADAMFGVAIPRFAEQESDLVWSIPTTGSPARPLLSRRALAVLPTRWIISELPVACCLLRCSQVSNAPPLGDYESPAAVLYHLMCLMRRRGFRPVLCNRVVLPSGVPGAGLFPELLPADARRFEQGVFRHFTYPQSAKAPDFSTPLPAEDKTPEWFLRHALHRLEPLAAAAYPAAGTRRSVVVDCRGMLPHFAGTTVAQLGFLRGFERLTHAWDIQVVAQDFAIKAHKLRERFPGLTFSERVEGHHAAIVHMNQLCFSGILVDLHAHGFLTACNMLDTIMWDIVLGAPDHVGRIWNLDAEYLDCIFYISEFSRRQFGNRFPVAAGVRESVTYLSFDADENVSGASSHSGDGAEPYVLVFGNGFDHKDVHPTVQNIRKAFPQLPVVAIGAQGHDVEGVTFLASGSIPDERIEQLVAHAGAVVFPSWVEGFGMPVVKALAYGRPVLVRSLPLWQEIADHSCLPGTLMEFHDEPSMAVVLEHALRGEYVHVLEQGAKVEGRPLDWTDCARRILEAFENQLLTADASMWLRRDRLTQVIAG